MAEDDVVRIIYGPPPPTADPADRFVSLDEALAGLPEAMEGAVLKALGAGGVMAEEWSKPVKGPYGWSVDRGETRVGIFWDGDLVIRDDDYGSPTAPRDVVLRLLAAEASDRLGWVWEVNTGEWIASSGKSMWGRHAETGEPITYDDHFGFTADELLAAMHGRFLLEDALREAGR